MKKMLFILSWLVCQYFSLTQGARIVIGIKDIHDLTKWHVYLCSLVAVIGNAGCALDPWVSGWYSKFYLGHGGVRFDVKHVAHACIVVYAPW